MYLIILSILMFFLGFLKYLLKINERKKYKRLVNQVKKESSIRWKSVSRLEALDELKNYKYDLLIIGGGSVGVGCALDAAIRGLKVALVEMNDFGSETSSKSTKLLHGGVRYLDHAICSFSLTQLNLVYNALQERFIILKMAPYLSKPISIMIPLYDRLKVIYYWILLTIYDLLSWDKSLGRTYFLNKKKSIQHFNNLSKFNLKGSIVYYDSLFDDGRLNVMLACSAGYHGANILNHIVFESFEQNCEGKIISAICRDKFSNQKINVSAKGFISAVGPFTDQVRNKAKINSSNIMVQSAGTHIVLPPEYSPECMGLVDSHTLDNRMLFILPWKGKTLVGSTEVKRKLKSGMIPSKKEVKFLINEVQRYVGKKIKKSEVLSAWTGFRPLVKDDSKKKTEEIVRSHCILDDKNGLVSVMGGKWTTFRLIAEEAIDKSVEVFRLKQLRPCLTKYIEVLGSENYAEDLYYEIKNHLNCDTEYAEHLLKHYGTRSFIIKKYFNEHFEKLSNKYEYRSAEVLYCIEYEYANTINDVVNNRLRIGYFDVTEASKIVYKVANIMKKYFSWNDTEEQRQIKDTKKVLDSLGMKFVTNNTN